MSKFRVILVRIFSHSDWIRRDTEYVHFSRSVSSQFSQKFCWALLLKWSGFTVTKKYEFYGLSRKSCSFSKFRFYVRNIKNAASDVSETLDFIIIIIILDFEWRVWIKTHNFNCVYWKLEGHTPSTVVGKIKIRVSNILRVTNNWERLLVYEFPIQLMVWGCCKARPSSVSRALSWWTANADCIFLKERFYSTSAVKAFFYSFDKTVNFVFMVFKFSLRQKSFPVG